MHLEYEENGFVCDIVDLKQKHVEAFSETIQQLGDSVPVVKFAGEICRAAVRSGWFASPPIKVEDVNEMDPLLVKWLASELGDLYTRATTVQMSLAVQVALYAQDSKKHTAPRELVYAWRTKQYGLPNGGGWLESDAGLVQRMTTALNVFDAFSGYQNAQATGRDKEWVESNPEAYQTVIEVTKLMEKK